MQLQPGERSILAYFANRDSAEQALKDLQQMGISNIRLDQTTGFNQRTNYATSATRLSSLTMGEYDRLAPDFGPLLAADPAVSGMTDRSDPGSHNFLVTVITDDTHVDQAIQTLHYYGAQV
ncbi:MAG: hypothetical protein ACOX6I_05370 [Syntrophomonadaceae bacterium]